ncbi:MAG: ABC transporter ATP-binding protein [Acidobacteriota bacterium]|nr:ABC transporter ATP-binding protein [Blastocatellia bacterium]MDW8241277.1 ABC transporter ATP-binding protein [Acidobacteriota bacterium]
MSHDQGQRKAILKTIGLEMHYPMGSVSVHALRGVDLEVFDGEFVAVMGPSGCGKSTLLHIIGGMLTPTRGQVFVDGHELSAMSDAERTELRRQKIGFVFQRFNLFPTLTVEGNLRLAERIYGYNGRDRAEHAARRAEILKLLGLDTKINHKPTQLSGGEQQRVALARAVINRPAILLADEPTGNLDSDNSQIVLRLLKDLNRQFHQTIMMITHNPEAAAIADRTLHMRDGKIVG